MEEKKKKKQEEKTKTDITQKKVKMSHIFTQYTYSKKNYYLLGGI